MISERLLLYLVNATLSRRSHPPPARRDRTTQVFTVVQTGVRCLSENPLRIVVLLDPGLTGQTDEFCSLLCRRHAGLSALAMYFSSLLQPTARCNNNIECRSILDSLLNSYLRMENRSRADNCCCYSHRFCDSLSSQEIAQR